MIDTHCHLDYCEPPVAELVGRARAAGVDADGHRRPRTATRSATRSRPPRTTTRWWRSSGRHPHETAGFDDLALEEIERAAAHPRVARHRRDRTRLLPRPRAARRPAARLRGAARAGRARLALPVVIHTRAAEDDTFAVLREHAGSAAGRDHALLLGARPAGRVRRARLHVLVRRQRDLPEGDRPPGGRARSVPDELLLVETDSPYLAPQPVRGKPNEPANVDAHRALRGRAARRRVRGARAHGGRERRARPRAVSGDEPRQASLRAAARVRRPAQPRARPELPDRRQHPARDRRGRRARRRTTWCSRWAAGSACCPSSSRRGSRTCTWWRWTARSRSRCATRSARSTTRRSTWPTR